MVLIRSDNKYDSYSRKVMDLLTGLGVVGGLSGALNGIGAVIAGFLVAKLLMSKIVKRIYHIRTYDTIFKNGGQRAQEGNGPATDRDEVD